jgi:hypothetical protein
VPGVPLGFALKAPGFAFQAPGLPFGFALKALDLPFIPGGQALEGASPVLLTQPAQRPQHDDADDHPLTPSAALPAKPETPGRAADLLPPAAMLPSGGLPATCPDLVMSPSR